MFVKSLDACRCLGTICLTQLDRIEGQAERRIGWSTDHRHMSADEAVMSYDVFILEGLNVSESWHSTQPQIALGTKQSRGRTEQSWKRDDSRGRFLRDERRESRAPAP